MKVGLKDGMRVGLRDVGIEVGLIVGERVGLVQSWTIMATANHKRVNDIFDTDSIIDEVCLNVELFYFLNQFFTFFLSRSRLE